MLKIFWKFSKEKIKMKSKKAWVADRKPYGKWKIASWNFYTSAYLTLPMANFPVKKFSVYQPKYPRGKTGLFRCFLFDLVEKKKKKEKTASILKIFRFYSFLIFPKPFFFFIFSLHVSELLVAWKVFLSVAFKINLEVKKKNKKKFKEKRGIENLVPQTTPS